MSLPQIDSALITLYQSIVAGVPTAYPNMPDVTDTTGVWATVNNVKVMSDPITLGNTGEDEVTGYFQVVVSDKLDVGTSGIETVREVVRSGFKIGSSSAFGTQVVQFISVKLSPVFKNGNYATGVIQIFWRARISRS